MKECFRCGVSSGKTLLFDAVGPEGIVKVCHGCADEEDIPLIRRPSDAQLKERERKQSIYERLSRIVGLGGRKKDLGETENELLKKQEEELKNIVDKNLNRNLPKEKKSKPDLIHNFHWIIMRARRSKHITQAQLGRKIGEPETAIKLAEQGILPDDHFKLVNKLESFLGVNLFKKDVMNEIRKKEPEKLVGFDPITSGNLTIEDMKKMREEKEKRIFSEVKKSEQKGKELDLDTEEIEMDSPKKEVLDKKEEMEIEESDVNLEKSREIDFLSGEKKSDLEEKNESEISKNSEKSKKRELTQEEIDRIIYGS